MTITYHENGQAGNGATIYDIEVDGKHVGLTHRGTKVEGWVLYPTNTTNRETGYTTRGAAAARAALVYRVAINDPITMSALPADPFDNVAARDNADDGARKRGMA